MSAAAFQILIRRFKSDPPEGARATAHRLKAIWDLYSPERRKSIITKHRYQHFPELPGYGRQHLRLLNVLVKAEEAELEVEACWEALDKGLSLADVRRALNTAKNQLLKNPKLDFALELKTLLSRNRRYVTETPVMSNDNSAEKQGPHWKRIAEIMGSRVMDVQEIIAALTRRGQMPESQRPGAYMSLILSTTKDSTGRLVFERVKKGHYRLAAAHPEEGNRASAQAAPAQPPKSSTAPTTQRPPQRRARPPVISDQWREWINQRSERLKIPPQEFVDRLFQSDMQKVLSQTQGPP